MSLERKIKDCQIPRDKNPSSKNLNDIEILHTDYDRMYEFIAKGTIVRSRATWYEYGEKSNTYFLNFENSRKKGKLHRKTKHRKNVNKLLYDFSIALVNDIEIGGLKMLDIQSMILSQRVMHCTETIYRRLP